MRVEARDDRGGLRTFGLGLLTGIVYFSGTLYWTVETMRGYGGLGTPVAAFVGFLLAFYLSFYPALFALVLRGGIRRLGPSGIWAAPVLWAASEWLRSSVGGGFPWVLLGASQARVLPVVQLASVGGVFAVSALLVLVGTGAAVVALSPRRVPWRTVTVVAAVVLATSAWGAWRVSRGALLASGKALRVGLVQGSVEQDQKYDARFRDQIMSRYLALSREAITNGADVVIWPEASTPFYFDLDTALAAPIRQLAAETETPFVIGTDQFAPGAAGAADSIYNAAVFVGADGSTRGSYRKMHLVPFGEYVPLKSLLFFVGPLVEAVSDFSAGTEPVVFDAGGIRASVAICYESVYPSISQAFVEHGSQLLATITNDAWFGRSSAAYQHFDLGALRAVEQGRYVVRAANTGISGAVDPYGRVLATTPLFEPTAIVVDVRLLADRTVYSYTGDLVAWAGLVVGIWVLVPARRRSGIASRRGDRPVANSEPGTPT